MRPGDAARENEVMQYRLRTLLILLAVVPPILAPLGAWGWREWQAYRERQRFWNQIQAVIKQGQPLDSRMFLCPSHPPANTGTLPVLEPVPNSRADASGETPES
ncbi:MAG: hypothetical protein SFU86_16540 [Pirellulaceae bacterium]|nr:hypothetical protein [Pirellulaceae bacterium]